MNNCDHHICGKEEQVWLPSADIRYGACEKHPWCTSCGVVKNISDDQPKHFGYWMNLFSHISSKIPITQVQKRLVVKELYHQECFQDLFGSYGSDQKTLFIKILSKYINLDSLDLDEIISL